MKILLVRSSAEDSSKPVRFTATLFGFKDQWVSGEGDVIEEALDDLGLAFESLISKGIVLHYTPWTDENIKEWADHLSDDDWNNGVAKILDVSPAFKPIVNVDLEKFLASQDFKDKFDEVLEVAGVTENGELSIKLIDNKGPLGFETRLNNW